MSAKVLLQVETPRVPNFVRLMLSKGQPSEHLVDVAELDDETLRRIGEQWTEALLRVAANRRRARMIPEERTK